MSNTRQAVRAASPSILRRPFVFLALTGALWTVAMAERIEAQPMEPIVIAGYFGRTSADMPTISDQITLSTNGKNRREFGLIRVQSQIGTSGRDVFSRTLNPVILVRGPKEMVERLDAAGPSQKVKIIGMFDLGSNGIIVTGVEIGEASSAKESKETVETGEKHPAEE